MKFVIGSKVRRKSDGLIGTISRVIAIEGYEYGVDFHVITERCKEDELELVEEEDGEEPMNVKTNIKMRGKLGMMLVCERCGEKEFVDSTSDFEATELIADLEFDSSVTDRWGEINGLSLCPKCSGQLNKMIDEFMISTGNVNVISYTACTEKE